MSYRYNRGMGFTYIIFNKVLKLNTYFQVFQSQHNKNCRMFQCQPPLCKQITLHILHSYKYFYIQEVFKQKKTMSIAITVIYILYLLIYFIYYLLYIYLYRKYCQARILLSFSETFLELAVFNYRQDFTTTTRHSSCIR